MATLVGALRRNWTMFRQPLAPKKDDALKFGILGAANIADMGFITPSKSHPEVIVYAVAARDRKRAVAYAKRHGIPEVRDSYQAILDDPAIDAVYIPTPNGLHFEWALKALAAGKHVLLEKPSTSNAHEAEMLFRSPLLTTQQHGDGRPPPVLMEAFHSFFVPSWRLFLSVIDRPSLAHVHARAVVPSFIAKDDDIRFDYSLAGGSAMDVGTYTVAAVRTTLGVEPDECVLADLTPMPPPRDKCDGMFHAQFRFPGDVIGEVEGGLRGSNFNFSWSTLTVQHRAVPAAETARAGDPEDGTEVKRTRKVVFVNFMFAPVYHRIDIEDEFVVTKKDSGDEVRRYVKKETKKAYSFREMGVDEPGEVYWPTYRYELEEFVNKVRGRPGNGTFFTHENSMAQMRALDMIYEKSGLGLRPASEYIP
ncbi:hypothetical protein DHEL01_v202848 [Diaporthe helianthi]|uniref:D-xylose 1-dehydrogenase (NADP(+), D-xylono-1,5-lactone-forming) n=1 Tax=Diaporthe helianthi TaxID=158607 RepID=A0A2P5I8C9_DIAHE|nr:hypothetical protein DHEL01_v202848 [Diaporthe helianthi]